MTNGIPPDSLGPSTPLSPANTDRPVTPFPVASASPNFSGGGWGSFEQFMGPKDFKEFQANICKQITQEIAKDRKRQKKAAEELRKSETGRS